MKKLELTEFKKVEISRKNEVKGGGSYTTMDGRENGDYREGDWLYDYLEATWYMVGANGDAW